MKNTAVNIASRLFVVFVFSMTSSFSWADWDVSSNGKVARVFPQNPDKPKNNNAVYVKCTNQGDIQARLLWDGVLKKGSQPLSVSYVDYSSNNPFKRAKMQLNVDDKNSIGSITALNKRMSLKKFILLMRKNDQDFKFSFKDDNGKRQSFSLNMQGGKNEINKVLSACNYNYSM